ncbi:MAG: hydrogenase maturation nickel metallochaperone HypA [Actinomycetia bacterium]|nr:hydrogenase maturation nickel metallochaperone HypA [Actinomycetes bacterium]
MHEVALVNTAAATLLGRLGDTPTRAVEIEIGPKVVPEVAANAWRIAVAGSALQDVPVTWTTVWNTLRCLECGAEYPGDKLALCPRCSGTGLVVQEPDEVVIAGWR